MSKDIAKNRPSTAVQTVFSIGKSKHEHSNSITFDRPKQSALSSSLSSCRKIRKISLNFSTNYVPMSSSTELTDANQLFDNSDFALSNPQKSQNRISRTLMSALSESSHHSSRPLHLFNNKLQFDIQQQHEQGSSEIQSRCHSSFGAFSTMRSSRKVSLIPFDSNTSPTLTFNKFMKKPILWRSNQDDKQIKPNKERTFSTFQLSSEELPQPEQSSNIHLNIQYRSNGKTKHENVTIDNPNATNPSPSEPFNLLDKSKTEQGINQRITVKQEQIMNICQTFRLSHSFFSNLHSTKNSQSCSSTTQVPEFTVNKAISTINQDNLAESLNNNQPQNKATPPGHFFLSKKTQRNSTSSSSRSSSSSVRGGIAKNPFHYPFSIQSHFRKQSKPTIETYNFVKIHFNPKVTQNRVKSESKQQQELNLQSESKFSKEALDVLKNLPDYKFDSNNKAVTAHIQLKLLQKQQNIKPKLQKSSLSLRNSTLPSTTSALSASPKKRSESFKTSFQIRNDQIKISDQSITTNKLHVEAQIGAKQGEQQDDRSFSIDQRESMKQLYDQLEKLNLLFNKRVEEVSEQQSLLRAESYQLDATRQSERISKDELETIKAVFKSGQQKTEESDIYVIDSIVSRLKFFSSFALETRKTLIKLAGFQKKTKGEIVFKQGDPGDQMYVIIYGSCEVNVKSQLMSGLQIERVVTTLYDGQQFGELSMMKTSAAQRKNSLGILADLKETSISKIKARQKHIDGMKELERYYFRKGEKRSASQIEAEYFHKIEEKNQSEDSKDDVVGRAATIQSAEETYLLCISKHDFQRILMELVQEEIDAKVQLLSSIHIFDRFQSYALIPLANLMKVQKYSTHDVIIQQGQEIDCFYIVAKGRLKVIRVEQTSREVVQKVIRKPLIFGMNSSRGSTLQNGKVNLFQQKSPSNHTCDELDDNTKKLEVKTQTYEFLRSSDLTPADKLYDFEVLNTRQNGVNQEKIHFQRFVEYQSLSVGDFFGGRMILGVNPPNNPAGVSLKTIIADTNDVEILVLEKKQVVYLPQFIHDWVYKALENQEEFDGDINVRSEQEKIQKWESYKEKTFQEQQQIIKDTASNKHRFMPSF